MPVPKKLCFASCKHCQQYNDEWAICWHRKIKGSKVQIGKRCWADFVKEADKCSNETQRKI